MLPADSPFASLPAPGPHPATAELRAYAAGTLSPADEHRIEAHTLDCERCAELLEGFSMSDAATTDQAVAELRTRLQARVGQEAEPVAGGWAWPRIAAAAALLAAVGTGFWGWEHYESAPATTAPIATTTPTAAPVVAPTPEVASAPATAPATQAAATAELPQEKTILSTAAAPQKAGHPAVAYARRSPTRGRLLQPPAAPAIAIEQAEDGKTAAVVTAAAPALADEQRSEPVIASAAPAPLASRSDLPGRTAAADTASARSEVAVLDSKFKMKAKAAPASTAAALVGNTPMPATMSIAPAPVAGTPSLNAYLRREAAKFEPEEGEKALNGAVRLRFIVGADGKLSNLQVVRGMRADYDEEALRLVCEGPAWRPGVAGGRRAALPVEVSVSF